MRATPVHPSTVIDTLRMTDRELVSLMARAQQGHDREAATSAGGRSAASDVRDNWPRLIVRVCHQRGQCTAYLVKPRDIHEHGLVALHGSYVHEGAACSVILRNKAGQPEQIPATILRCRHIAGRVHELVAVFNLPLRPDDYCLTDGMPGTVKGGGTPPPRAPDPIAAGL